MHDASSSTGLRGAPSRRGRPPRILMDSPNVADADILSHSLTSNRATTFTSSLAIAVEGAARIVTNESTTNRGTQTPQQVPITDGKRAPRKSKTDALAALHSRARSSSIGPDDFVYDDTNDRPHFPRPISVAPRLDLSTVKTTSPGSVPPKATPRPFDLEDCPSFYPTMEEFRDPMSYIRSISDRARPYGLCKIVPPAEWKMPFVADTEVSQVQWPQRIYNQICLIFPPPDISFQDSPSTVELHRGLFASQSQLFGAIISFS
jgi:histone demethylase JARID1